MTKTKSWFEEKKICPLGNRSACKRRPIRRDGFVLLFYPTEAKVTVENSFYPCPKLFHLLGSVHSASRHGAVGLKRLGLAELLKEEARL